MEVGNLYQFVLVLVLVGLIAGVGVLILDKFSTTSSVTSEASTSINAARDAVAEVPEDWMSLIVTIGILAVILGLVIASFAYVRGRR